MILWGKFVFIQLTKVEQQQKVAGEIEVGNVYEILLIIMPTWVLLVI